MTRPEYVIRSLEDDDHAIIFGSWRHSFREDGCEKFVPGYIWDHALQKRMERYIKKSVFKIAVDPQHPDYVLGWSCSSRLGHVHYVYVRDMFRNHGVAKSLVGGKRPMVCTHWTKACESIASEKPAQLIYKPSLRGKE